MSSPGVSIVISTHNRGPILARSLESLSQLRYPAGVDVEVVVVANACTDDTVAQANAFRDRLPNFRCVEEPTVGVSYARNRTMRESRFDIVGMVDDDIWCEPQWLEATLAMYRETPADMVSGRLTLWWCSVDRPAWMDGPTLGLLSCLDLGERPVEMVKPDAVAANFSFKREVFDKVGPFRTDLGRVGGKSLAAGEETFFVQQAMRAGYRLFYSPEAHIKHWVAPHRIQTPYLTGVAKGTAFTISRLADNGGLLHAAKAVGAGTVRLAAGRIGRALTKPDTGARIMADVKMALGQGQIAGAIARWRDGPIASVPEGGAGGSQR